MPECPVQLGAGSGATIHNTAQPDTVTREVVRWMVLNLTREDEGG